MRHEVFTGPERRRGWSAEEKLAIVDEVGVNGRTLSDVAMRHDLGPQNIYHWRRELSREGLRPSGVDVPVFLPVELAVADSIRDERATAMAPWLVRLRSCLLLGGSCAAVRTCRRRSSRG